MRSSRTTAVLIVNDEPLTPRLIGDGCLLKNNGAQRHSDQKRRTPAASAAASAFATRARAAWAQLVRNINEADPLE